jgi:hypothetical protein
MRERGLLKALLVAAVFWFLGGVTQMAVNTLGKSSMGLSSTRTSLMVAAIGFGIAAGCAMTGLFGGKGNGSRWVTGGAWLLFVALSLIAFLGSGQLGVPASSGVQGEGILTGIAHADLLEWSLRSSMTLLGDCGWNVCSARAGLSAAGSASGTERQIAGCAESGDMDRHPPIRGLLRDLRSLALNQFGGPERRISLSVDRLPVSRGVDAADLCTVSPSKG